MHIMQNPESWKSKIQINLKLNNHRNDVNDQKMIPACHRFKTQGHNFMKHAKFILIEQLSETSNVRCNMAKAKAARRFLDY